ncbi:MAG: metal ABC transporter permease [Mangrovicoccus sp.]
MQFDPFLIRAALAASGVALAAGPLGCFVVWRRMAYFSDATAHAALLGVALSLILHSAVELGVLIAALAMAFAVGTAAGRQRAGDTVLGVLAHGALAFGVLVSAWVPGPPLDLEAYLFGDVLAVGEQDIALIWGGAVLVLGLLIWQWQNLLTVTVGADLAQAHDVNAKRTEILLLVALALAVAVAIKVVGALLIGALLIIPASTARSLTRSPEAMAVLATLLGLGACLAGIWLSWTFDSPTGPSIVAASATGFGVVLAGEAMWKRLRG